MVGKCFIEWQGMRENSVMDKISEDEEKRRKNRKSVKRVLKINQEKQIPREEER